MVDIRSSFVEGVAVDTHELGTPICVDLQSPEPAAVATFYATLFGWQFGNTATETGGHRTALLRGRPAAGIGQIREPGLPGWTTYVAVADVLEAARKVTAAGGTVLSPPSGRDAMFADPSGTRFAVRRIGDTPAAAVADGPGAFSWGELITDDVDASGAFYGSVFGWTLTAPEGPLQRREWQLHGRSISGLLPRPPAMAKDIPPYWDVYFTVTDAVASADTAIAAGGMQLMRPTDIGVGHIAVFLDPAGAVFTVMAPKN
jgi:predicted enzyme related to lactoylglutathione lyase